MATAVADGENLIPFVSFVMSEKPIAGPVNEPRLEHPLRCHAGHLLVHHERKQLALLPQCANICVTTNDDKRESSLGKATPDLHPFSFQVVTVIDPAALEGRSDTKPTFRTALRNLHKRHRDYADIRHNILFHSSSLPKRERFSWRKEANSTLRSTRSKFRSYSRPISHHSPKVARHSSKQTDKSNDVKEEISKLVLDEHYMPPEKLLPATAESAVVSASTEEAPAAPHQNSEEPQPEDTISPKSEKRPTGLKLIKKKKKKKKVKPEKRKFNLLKFKQKVPIEGTNYQMEVYLDKEVIDKTRQGKIDISKEPQIRVSYNKVADLRDEFSSYCSERKKLKNWLYYA